MTKVIQANSSNDLKIIKTLFLEYQQELDVDLCFQEFEHELNTLPGVYDTPNGRLFLLKVNSEMAGCIALKPVGNNHCEIKRLYVKPDFRGQQFGRLLIIKLIEAAREIGYSAIRLDTIPRLKSAICMYRELGFVDSTPTYQHKDMDLVFLSLILN